MSIGHSKDQRRTAEELHLILGEADTSKWYARPKRLVLGHDVPYGGGSSVDASELYIDEQLYKEVMCRPEAPRHLWVTVRGMSGRQIIACWIKHEGCEISAELGDNPCDTYLASHGVATADEEDDVEAVLGKGKAAWYEKQIEPALKRCLRRSLSKIVLGTFNPPKHLWCGPILDKPDANDLKLIRGLRKAGVSDAFKLSKGDPSVMYGMGGRKCEDCKMMEQPKKELSTCSLVAGMVRWNRQCERFVQR
jgi:hypothetical protein